MIKLTIPVLLGFILLHTFPIQGVDLAISGSGDLIDTESDTETEGSGKVVTVVSRPLSTEKPHDNSIILPDDEDEYYGAVVIPEGSALDPKETKTVTEKMEIDVEKMEIGGSGSSVECTSDGQWCWCVDENGVEMENTMRRFGRAELELTNCSPAPEVFKTKPTTRPTPSTSVAAPTTTVIPVRLPDRMVCSSTRRYCWCVDLSGKEIAGTRLYMVEASLGPEVTCPTGETVRTTQADTTTAPTPPVRRLPDRMVCNNDGVYCWCLDLYGNEIPGTRLYMEGTVLSPYVACPLGETSKPNLITAPADTDITLITEETTTAKPRKITPYMPPYDVDDINPKTVKPKPLPPVDNKDKDEEIGQGAGKGSRNGIDKTDVPPSFPFFTHPGILAAIIGGGVVALLSAMLLIMFIIYRMRKKDEGSYPLDPDSKPPRLHTYTRAPNKEFYA